MASKLLNVCAVFAITSLIVCVVAPLLVLFGRIEMKTYLFWLNLATLVWFVCGTVWITPQLFGHRFDAMTRRAFFRFKKK